MIEGSGDVEVLEMGPARWKVFVLRCRSSLVSVEFDMSNSHVRSANHPACPVFLRSDISSSNQDLTNGSVLAAYLELESEKWYGIDEECECR